MTNMKPTTKSQIKALETRVATLRAEMTDSYTVSLGAAAVKCVAESLEAWTAELRRVRAACYEEFVTPRQVEAFCRFAPVVLAPIDTVRRLEAELRDELGYSDCDLAHIHAVLSEEMRQLGHECINGVPRGDCAACKAGQ